MQLIFRSLVIDLPEWISIEVDPEAGYEEILQALEQNGVSRDYVIGEGYQTPGRILLESETAQRLAKMSDLTLQRKEGLGKVLVRFALPPTKFTITQTLAKDMTCREVYQEVRLFGYYRPKLTLAGGDIPDGNILFPFATARGKEVIITELNRKLIRLRPSNEDRILDFNPVEKVGQLYRSLAIEYPGFRIWNLNGSRLNADSNARDNIPPSLVMALDIFPPAVAEAASGEDLFSAFEPAVVPGPQIDLIFRTIDPLLPQWITIKVHSDTDLIEVYSVLSRFVQSQPQPPRSVQILATGEELDRHLQAFDLVKMPDLHLNVRRESQLVLNQGIYTGESVLTIPMPQDFTIEQAYVALERMGFTDPAIRDMGFTIARKPSIFPKTQYPEYLSAIDQAPPVIWIRPGNQGRVFKVNPVRFPTFADVLKVLASQTSFTDPVIYSDLGPIRPEQKSLDFAEQILALVNREIVRSQSPPRASSSRAASSSQGY